MDPTTREEILNRYDRYPSVRGIARQLGIGRKKVYRVLVEAGRIQEKPATPANKRVSKLDRFLDLIREKVEMDLTGTRIFREIGEEGYTGGRTILFDFIREIRGPKKEKRRACRRFETPPAKEAQVDWSPYRLEVAGRIVIVHAFSMILCHSRKLHIRFYSNERLETLLYAHVQAFDEFQGVAWELVYDNMATVTLGRTSSGEPIWHPTFLEFSKHYMYRPYVCRPYDPDRKGKVERPFSYIEEDFLKGKRFASLAALNDQVRHWLENIANKRTHGTTRRVPDEAWEEERPLLIRLPERPYGTYRQEVRRVHIDGTVSFDGIRYSVPSHLAETEVTIRATPTEIEILDRLGQRVAAHPIDETKGPLVIDPAHLAPRKPPNESELKDAFLKRFPTEAVFLDGLKKRMGRLCHLHLKLLLRLILTYSEPAVLNAIQKASSSNNFNAYAVERILGLEIPDPQEPPAPMGQKAKDILCAIEEDDDWGSLDQYHELEETEGEADDHEQ